jgi:iron complex transport system substrate-binding protein
MNLKHKIGKIKFRCGLGLILLGSFSASSVLGQDMDPGPHRIISMAPNLTQIVFDIGAADRLIGVSDFCRFPKEARLKKKMGGWLNPNYEKILSEKPDLVLALKFNGKLVDHLRRMKVPVLALDCMTVRDVLKAYELMGKRLGRQKEAEDAKIQLEKRLEKVRKKSRVQKPMSVLFIVDRMPGTLEQIYGAGAKTFVNEIIGLTGGKNILADSLAPYPLVSKEQILKRDPEVIVEALVKSRMKKGGMKRATGAWKKLSTLQAVRNDHVYGFTNEDYLIPGPTMANLAEYLSDIFQKAQAEKKVTHPNPAKE